MKYIPDIRTVLFNNGYPSASIDTIQQIGKVVIINLFLGPHYNGVLLMIDALEEKNEIMGLFPGKFDSLKPVSFKDIQLAQIRILKYYMSRGYPFISISLDNISFADSNITAHLKLIKGPLYHLDSLHQYGKLKIKKSFLNHYLMLQPSAIYDVNKLNVIERKLNELSYARMIQKPDLSMLGTGGILNIYLDPKRASQFDALIGIIPPADVNSKTRITGDVNLFLQNSLGGGEAIILNWQQLQKQSPRLNIGFKQPYLLNSNFGVDFNFNLLKKDSSYIQIIGQLGILYDISQNQIGKVFINTQRSYLLQGGYDTNRIRFSRQLPSNIDYSSNSIGIEYAFQNVDYKNNPSTGSLLNINLSVGLKKIRANNDILNLKDPSAPSYNFKALYDTLGNQNYNLQATIGAAHYFGFKSNRVLKVASQVAIINSDKLFKNELFVIGGYRLLRGFDEESIYADRYAVFTTEYRYLTGRNSYLYVFNDIGFTHTHFQEINYSSSFISLGMGVSFETKAGLLNVSYAVGKRSDVAFNLKEASKIHFGFINYF